MLCIDLHNCVNKWGVLLKTDFISEALNYASWYIHIFHLKQEPLGNGCNVNYEQPLKIENRLLFEI